MGEGERSHARLSLEDERVFPELLNSGYRLASDKDATYNCVAFAAGDMTRKWDPSVMPLPGYYWPKDASRGRHPDDLRSAFEAIGYDICESFDLEDGFEKVALYVNQHGKWTHAARQESNGDWASKLGDEEDIRHRSPHCFAGSMYGDVIYVMRRPVKRTG
jgi:hypothetical protein